MNIKIFGEEVSIKKINTQIEITTKGSDWSIENTINKKILQYLETEGIIQEVLKGEGKIINKKFEELSTPPTLFKNTSKTLHINFKDGSKEHYNLENTKVEIGKYKNGELTITLHGKKIILKNIATKPKIS